MTPHPRESASRPPAALCALLTTALLAGCGQESAAKPGPIRAGDVLLTIDGIDIDYGEVEPVLDLLTQVHPEAGRKTAVQMILTDFLVPLHLARREFAAERGRALQQALDLTAVATNAYELAAQNVPAKERKRYSRRQPQLPVALFLFDPLMIGAVSPPIEVPRGYIVAAAHDYLESPSAVADLVEATQVGYFTHTADEWAKWYASEQARVADRVTYVHPDYREALPPWCKTP